MPAVLMAALAAWHTQSLHPCHLSHWWVSTWLLPKASEATYFRQQYKNTGAGPKGGKSASFPEVSKADSSMSYVL